MGGYPLSAAYIRMKALAKPGGTDPRTQLQAAAPNPTSPLDDEAMATGQQDFPDAPTVVYIHGGGPFVYGQRSVGGRITYQLTLLGMRKNQQQSVLGIDPVNEAGQLQRQEGGEIWAEDTDQRIAYDESFITDAEANELRESVDLPEGETMPWVRRERMVRQKTGDSAGGNLAAVVILDSAKRRGRLEEIAGIKLRAQCLIEWAKKQQRNIVEAGEYGHKAWLLPDLGLTPPPFVIITAELDPLRDQGEADINPNLIGTWEAYLDYGVLTLSFRYNGMIHGADVIFVAILPGAKQINARGRQGKRSASKVRLDRLFENLLLDKA
nr:esterase [uncultured bacterium]